MFVNKGLVNGKLFFSKNNFPFTKPTHETFYVIYQNPININDDEFKLIRKNYNKTWKMKRPYGKYLSEADKD